MHVYVYACMYVSTSVCKFVCVCTCAYEQLIMDKPQPIILNFLPIILLSKAQKFAYYAQYYAHDYCNYATVCI